MLHVDLGEYNRHFIDNLRDWCDGGPKFGGWTRYGPSFVMPNVVLRSVRRENISVEDGLSKNIEEVRRWHIDYLTTNKPLIETNYYSEYLLPRMSPDKAVRRASDFNILYNSISTYGFDHRYPVMVAELNIGIKYFRFDGCHRLASLAALGVKIVPALVFGVTLIKE